MKRLKILGMIACVGLLFAPAAVFSEPAGPTEGIKVNIVNPLPVPVEGEVTATIPAGVTINNDENNPVPVEGEVTATIDGDVTVKLDEGESMNVNILHNDYQHSRSVMKMQLSLKDDTDIFLWPAPLTSRFHVEHITCDMLTANNSDLFVSFYVSNDRYLSTEDILLDVCAPFIGPYMTPGLQAQFVCRDSNVDWTVSVDKFIIMRRGGDPEAEATLRCYLRGYFIED